MSIDNLKHHILTTVYANSNPNPRVREQIYQLLFGEGNLNISKASGAEVSRLREEFDTLLDPPHGSQDIAQGYRKAALTVFDVSNSQTKTALHFERLPDFGDDPTDRYMPYSWEKFMAPPTSTDAGITATAARLEQIIDHIEKAKLIHPEDFIQSLQSSLEGSSMLRIDVLHKALWNDMPYYEFSPKVLEQIASPIALFKQGSRHRDSISLSRGGIRGHMQMRAYNARLLLQQSRLNELAGIEKLLEAQEDGKWTAPVQPAEVIAKVRQLSRSITAFRNDDIKDIYRSAIYSELEYQTNNSARIKDFIERCERSGRLIDNYVTGVYVTDIEQCRHLLATSLAASKPLEAEMKNIDEGRYPKAGDRYYSTYKRVESDYFRYPNPSKRVVANSRDNIMEHIRRTAGADKQAWAALTSAPQPVRTEGRRPVLTLVHSAPETPQH